MDSSSGGGGDSNDTLPDDTRPLARGPAPRLSLPGYDVGDTIGEGGMGEVLLARDAKFGRDVAIKRMRAVSPTPELVERFLREAKIQARLDHPAIVPVFDLGHDRNGLPYFTMKRLAGETMHQLLCTGGPVQQRLLRAFVEVCLAVELAHTKGVIHRDLKPTNIMLGDYGEVYVLDWGVARIITRIDAMTPHAGSPSLSPDSHTQVGALLGTPGYMAPEQVQGETVGPAADVYSLGCILFEILTGEPRHPRTGEALSSTLTSPHEAPSRRRPDLAIAPELDEACAAALEAAPSARPTARALSDRVQRYLDGDRDLARRRELARDNLAAAQDAARDPGRRADAIRMAGRALALDPEAQETAELVGRLMIEPPSLLPPELHQDLEKIDNDVSLKGAGLAANALLVPFALIPLVLWTGVKSWTAFAAIFGLIAGLAAFARVEVHRGRTHEIIPLLVGGLLFALVASVASPFIFVPAAITAFAIGPGSQPQLAPRPGLVFAAVSGAFLLPVIAELLGLLPPTWRVEGDELIITSQLIHFTGAATSVLLVAVNLFLVVTITVFSRSLSKSRRSARRDLEIQAWQLRQLLPVDRDHSSRWIKV